jgi:hypothetical protein
MVFRALARQPITGAGLLQIRNVPSVAVASARKTGEALP